MKKKRKNPCWNCDSGVGSLDSHYSKGTPFEIYHCDYCGARWSRFNGVYDLKIKPTLRDAFIQVNHEIHRLWNTIKRV